MADIEAAREEIQKVVRFLVSRFGSQEEVFDHLSLALAHLREAPPSPVVEEAAAVEPPPLPEETEPEPVEVEEPVVEEPPQLPQRRITRRRR